MKLALLTVFVATGICGFAQESAPAQVVLNTSQLTPDEAAQLETSLQSNPDDLLARQKLLHYYFAPDVAGRAQNRFRHIQWLIVNHPESDVTIEVQAQPDLADFAAARELWLQAADRFASDQHVLLNASKAMRRQDPETALALLKRARPLNPNNYGVNQQIAMLLAQGVRNSTANYTVFAAQARKELDACDASEAAVCGLAGRLLKSDSGNNPDLDKLADHLTEVGRAGGFDPAGPLTADGSPPAPGLPEPSDASPRIRVGGAVQAANLLYQEPVVYPPLAVQARVQGTVRFQVVISKDGAVKSIQLISGHPLLVNAAHTAVEKYRYKPTLLNGEPIQVLTVIEVPFVLAQ